MLQIASFYKMKMWKILNLIKHSIINRSPAFAHREFRGGGERNSTIGDFIIARQYLECRFHPIRKNLLLYNLRLWITVYIAGLVVYTAYVQHLKFHLLSMLRYGKNLDVRVNFIIRFFL